MKRRLRVLVLTLGLTVPGGLGVAPANAGDVCGGTSGTLHSTLQPTIGGSFNQETHDLERLNTLNNLNSDC